MRESLATELAGSTPFDEIYSDFDWRDPSSEDRGICLFSYGEYVSSRNLDYRPILERAERFAQFHCDLLNGASVPDEKLKIVRREWFCATHPDIAVVHVYFRA